MKNNFFKSFILGLFLCCFSPLIFAQSYSDFYFFGDSLSDVGNNPEHGHMPYSDGLNWVQLLVSKFDQKITYSDNGGHDYAYGGAQTDSLSPGKAAVNRGLQAQIAALLTDHPRLDEQALYFVWVGANDVFNGILQRGMSPIDIANQGADNIKLALVKLHDAGASHIVLGNLPDLSETPLASHLAGEMQQKIAGAAALFNAKVLVAIKEIGFPVMLVDYYTLFDVIVHRPADFGFTHSYTEQCVAKNGDSCKGYIFWDNLHPTQAAYQIIADYDYRIITAIN